MNATVNADLFRVASMFVSQEAARYYLQGVLIEKHHTQGVLMVATDGHRMMVVHDPDGSTTLDPIIVRLDKATMAATKATKGENMARLLVVEGEGDAKILRGDAARSIAAIDPKTIIDGTFLMWSRVLPNVGEGRVCGSFNAKYLADFAKAAGELNRKTKTPSMTVTAYEDGAPALIRFSNVANAFGVLMPMRGRGEAVDQMPDFMAPPVQEDQMVAAE